MLIIMGLEKLTDFEIEYISSQLTGPEAEQPGPLQTANILLTAERCRRLIRYSKLTEVIKVGFNSKLNNIEEALEYIEGEAKKLEGLRV